MFGKAVRLVMLVALALCIGGAAVAFARPDLKARAVDAVREFAIAKRLQARGAFPHPKIANPKPGLCPEGTALVDDRFCMDRYEASTVLIDEQGRVKAPHSPYEMVDDLRVRAESRPGVHPAGSSVTCPCVWKAEGTDVRPVAIPKYNNENRWYIEKYQSIVTLFE